LKEGKNAEAYISSPYEIRAKEIAINPGMVYTGHEAKGSS
jgi:hypothetical protein